MNLLRSRIEMSTTVMDASQLNDGHGLKPDDSSKENSKDHSSTKANDTTEYKGCPFRFMLSDFKTLQLKSLQIIGMKAN